jgi:hypothetical protein
MKEGEDFHFSFFSFIIINFEKVKKNYNVDVMYMYE